MTFCDYCQNHCRFSNSFKLGYQDTSTVLSSGFKTMYLWFSHLENQFIGRLKGWFLTGFTGSSHCWPGKIYQSLPDGSKTSSLETSKIMDQLKPSVRSIIVKNTFCVGSKNIAVPAQRCVSFTNVTKSSTTISTTVSEFLSKARVPATHPAAKCPECPNANVGFVTSPKKNT